MVVASHLALLFSISGSVSAWSRTPSFSRPRMIPFAGGKNNNVHTEQETTVSDNPCWQDFYDDDCSMTNIAAAHFVAAEWIKSMPCGAGIEDCDMPADLTVPETRPEAGVDHVDVMGFLGLRRSKSVTKSDNEDYSLAP